MFFFRNKKAKLIDDITVVNQVDSVDEVTKEPHEYVEVRLSGENKNKTHVGDLPEYSTVVTDGHYSELIIQGSLGSNCTIKACGVHARVIIEGDVGPDSRLTADGQYSEILIKGTLYEEFARYQFGFNTRITPDITEDD